MDLKNLVKKINDNVSFELDLKVLEEIISDILPMRRATEDVINSFHITTEMKPVLEDAIEKFENSDIETLLEKFLQLDGIVIDNMNDTEISKEERYYKTTLGNSLMVVYLNEIIERLEK